MTGKRITHRHIAKAVQALNARRGITYGDAGYLQYADIRGDGRSYRPGFYVTLASGGVVNVSDNYRKQTMRETLAHLLTLN